MEPRAQAEWTRSRESLRRSGLGAQRAAVPSNATGRAVAREGAPPLAREATTTMGTAEPELWSQSRLLADICAVRGDDAEETTPCDLQTPRTGACLQRDRFRGKEARGQRAL